MKRGTFLVDWEGGSRELSGYIIGPFGIDERYPRDWRITHIPTGFAGNPLQILSSRDAAVRFVKALIKHGGDIWTSPHFTKFQKPPGKRTKIYKAAQRAYRDAVLEVSR